MITLNLWLVAALVAAFGLGVACGRVWAWLIALYAALKVVGRR